MKNLNKLLFLFTILTDFINIRLEDKNYVEKVSPNSELISKDIYDNVFIQKENDNKVNDTPDNNDEPSNENIDYENEEEIEIEKLIYQEYNKDFTYSYNCPFGQEIVCNNINDIVKKAMDTISNTVEIYQPIVFDVHVDDLSKYNNTSFSSGCVDTNYVVLRDYDNINIPPYSYPQALAKQLLLNKNYEFKEKDFTIVIDTSNSHNHEKDKYFRNLELTVLHEILHGLGFGSETGQLIEMLKEDKRDSKLKYNLYDFYYVPREIQEIDKDKLMRVRNNNDFVVLRPTIKYKGLFPLSVYEKNFVDIYTKTNLFEGLEFLYKELDCFKSAYLIGFNDKFPECIKKLSSRTKHLISLIPMNYYFKYHSTGFLNLEEKTIPLQTFDYKYYYGKSINHIEFSKEKTFNNFINSTMNGTEKLINLNDVVNVDEIDEMADENILMYYRNLGFSSDILLSTVAKNNKYGLISSDILSVLTTIGWTEKGKPRSLIKFYVAEDVEIPEQLSYPLFKKEYEFSTKP